jgi:hypothetical protein
MVSIQKHYALLILAWQVPEKQKSDVVNSGFTGTIVAIAKRFLSRCAHLKQLRRRLSRPAGSIGIFPARGVCPGGAHLQSYQSVQFQQSECIQQQHLRITGIMKRVMKAHSESLRCSKNFLPVSITFGA